MLSTKLFNLPSFKRQYEALITLSVCSSIPNLTWLETHESLLSKLDWNNILSIGSVLSFSTEYSHLEAALRIAQTCISEESTNNTQKAASAVILQNLTNIPAIGLSIARNLISENYKSELPLTVQIDTIRTNICNSIMVNGNLIPLNKFQKDVHEAYEKYRTISISAPTSAGKSFILCQILLEELLKGDINIIYIVPTRALISQVEEDLRTLVKVNSLKDINITTVPQIDGLEKSNVFVFTQERLHWFLIENEAIRIDLAIIDEAQKIDDGNRGILLQQKIEELVKLNKDIKIYFSSPFTSNPEMLFENVKNSSEKHPVDTQFIAVNQNLLYLNQVPRKIDIWKVTLCLPDGNIELGTVLLKDRPNSEFKKLIFITEALSIPKTGSIIYSNGSADAESISLILYDLVDDIPPSDRIDELIKLVKKTIHAEYSLAKVLKKGIAFHYGNMPLLIRQEIEKLFKEGEIKYLVCTSTLLEGVNLPAKSIFIRKPTRGLNKALTSNDFWNLAGRAGRWGKEFSGNIICIEPTGWKIPPNPNKSKQTIKRAIDEIENKGFELIDYIKAGSPRPIAVSRQDLESAFGYYYIKFLNEELEPERPFHVELIELFNPLKKNTILPDYIIKRNPGISPIAQQGLYDFFQINIENIENMLPIFPEDENAVDEYKSLVGRINTTLTDAPDALSMPRAILLVNWMRGKPLSFLISSSFKSYQNKGRLDKKLPLVIRETMNNVEDFVRFKFAKDSSCYVDILRYFLEINGRLDLIDRIPPINLWLEFGVSQKTHLSLLSLGLTRNTVIELSEYITNSQMSKSECLQWLKGVNLEQLNLSPIIIADIEKSLI